MEGKENVLDREAGPRRGTDKIAIAPRGLTHFAVIICVTGIFCLQPRCAAQATLKTAVNSPPLNPTPTEKQPMFSDVTIWTAQTVGSVTLMSNYEGQRMFAMGVGLRKHLHTIRHADASWNFGIGQGGCLPCQPLQGGRITTAEVDRSEWRSRRGSNCACNRISTRVEAC